MKELSSKKNLSLPEVQFSDEGRIRHLHLESIWIQGSMDMRDPLRLVHEYVQQMMAWLLFVEPDTVQRRQSLQLGLGAASLTKFCSKVLRMPTAVIELNPKVIAACQGWFQLPEDGPLLQVVQADASEEILRPRWRGAVDALQVDLYDREAAAPVLDSTDFYAACRDTLTEDGCMTVNLFGRKSSFARSVEHMAQAFGRNALWSFKPTSAGNTVVLAQRIPNNSSTYERRASWRAVWEARSRLIETRWGLAAGKWARSLAPIYASE